MASHRSNITTNRREEVQLGLGELPDLPLSRATRKPDGTHLSVVEKVLLSEKDGVTIHALLGRTRDGWVAGWLVLAPGKRKRLRQGPVIKGRNKPQGERDRALALALKGALSAISESRGPLDWRQASLLKLIGLPQSKPKSGTDAYTG